MRKTKKYFVGFFLLWLLLIEWFVDMILKLWTTFHGSIKELTIALESVYNELNEQIIGKD
jgi:hypothetical protein